MRNPGTASPQIPLARVGRSPCGTSFFSFIARIAFIARSSPFVIPVGSRGCDTAHAGISPRQIMENIIKETDDEATINEEFEAGYAVDAEEADGIDQYTDLHDDDDDDDDPDYDADRYDTAIGWQPPDPYAKLKEKLRKEREENDPGPNPLYWDAGKKIHFGRVSTTTPALLGDLWRTSEITILFADTGIGKTIFAVQVGESLARGLPVGPFALDTGPQKVSYLDLELTREQFTERYCCPEHLAEAAAQTSEPDERSEVDLRDASYPFSDNFCRVYLEHYWDPPKAFKNYGQYLSWAVSNHVFNAGSNILIIDNISFLNTANTHASTALRLMKALKCLRDERGLSILVLAHTGRRRPGSPLSMDDLQGSRNLANFADNLCAIGRSGNDADLRYIKRIKGRTSRMDPFSEEVAAFRIERSAGPAGADKTLVLEPDEVLPKKAFLGFEFVGNTAEREMIPRQRDDEERERIATAARSLQSAGLSLSKIAEQLNISKATAGRYCTPTEA